MCYDPLVSICKKHLFLGVFYLMIMIIYSLTNINFKETTYVLYIFQVCEWEQI